MKTRKEFRREWILDPSKEMIIESEIDIAYDKYKLNLLTIPSVSRFHCVWAKARQRFEKEMHDLNVVINQDCTNNERVSELVEWYRKECRARPEMYKGDEVVMKAIRDAAVTGLSFSFSLMEAYRILKANLAFMDNMRAMG